MKVNDRHWRDRRGYDSRARPTSRRRQQSILVVPLTSRQFDGILCNFDSFLVEAPVV